MIKLLQILLTNTSSGLISFTFGGCLSLSRSFCLICTLTLSIRPASYIVWYSLCLYCSYSSITKSPLFIFFWKLYNDIRNIWYEK
jgi:hypothetical protein